MVSSIVNILKSSTWFIDGMLTVTSTLEQSRLGSDGNEGVLHIPQNSKTGSSPSDAV